MGQHEYEVIKEYELGLAPWTEEVELAYMKMYASFVFGKDCLDSVPVDWWEQHKQDFMS